jgi:hypothetical protein
MKCQNCNTEISFVMGLKQPTPFRFKCSKCEARYKVSTPHMVAICVSQGVLVAGLALGLCFGTDRWGIMFTLPFVALMAGVFLAVELWMHKYISKRGIFTRIGITEPSTPPYSENRSGSPQG